MAHRDPETGKFVAEEHSKYDDIEVVTTARYFTVAAADLDGLTGEGFGEDQTFEGVGLIDYDEVVDRNESLHLLNADHRLVVASPSTQTADGTVRCSVEISSSPARQASFPVEPFDALDDQGGDFPISAASGITAEDTIDLIGRPLEAVAHSPFSDGATGVGGSGSSTDDNVTLDALPDPVAEFHPRDELFLNGSLDVSNISDGSIYFAVILQHTYGVKSD